MKKKTILHIIQNFGRGGAETTVIGVLKNLNEYNNIVVTMDSLNEFGSEFRCDKHYSLELKNYYLFPFAINKLRRIIVDNKVDIVHSQLYWSTILARFACPKEIPLVTSIQASISDSVEYRKNWVGFLDRFSFNRRKSIILGVSEFTLQDYFSFLKLRKQESQVLYNFVDTSVFESGNTNRKKDGKSLKLIAVGNLKTQKNHHYLLEAFKQLKNENISLDIYGDGFLKSELQEIITKNDLPVRLMGKINNLPDVISQYDLFVLSSLYEGFSLAVLEGMVKEIPMLLSDIPTFREQCDQTANYFSLSDVSDFINKVKYLRDHPEELRKNAIAGKDRVLSKFTIDHHMTALRQIYAKILHPFSISPDFR